MSQQESGSRGCFSGPKAARAEGEEEGAGSERARHRERQGHAGRAWLHAVLKDAQASRTRSGSEEITCRMTSAPFSSRHVLVHLSQHFGRKEGFNLPDALRVPGTPPSSPMLHAVDDLLYLLFTLAFYLKASFFGI